MRYFSVRVENENKDDFIHIMFYQNSSLMKSKQYKGLLLFVALFLFVFSCQEPMEIKNDDATLLSKEDVEFKAKLESAAKVFGKVFHSREAQQELIGFSLTDGNDGEVHLNLRTLFENESMRSTSSIIKRLNDLNNPASRGTDWDFDDFNYDDFIAFISENDISIIAPYLAENFQPEVIGKSLTVSFYTDDMNIDVVNPAYHTTPGYYIDYGMSIPYLQPVIVDDNYAYNNPTIVLGRFDDPEPIMNSTSSTQNTSSVVCTDLTAANRLTLRMPEFQLNGNTRGWPNPNYIYLWVGVGEIEFDPSNNLPKASTNVNNVINRERVSRYNGRNQKWIGSPASFLLQNWKYPSEDMYISWGYYKWLTTFEVTFTTKVTFKKGTPEAELGLSSKVTAQGSVRQMNGVSFDKCVTLTNNNSKINQGFGFRNGLPVYRFGGVSWYYTTSLQ